jgi:hypothetical protein
MNFTWGEYGVNIVIKFAEHFFALDGFDAELVGLKIDSLIAEAQHYMCVVLHDFQCILKHSDVCK